MLSTESTRLLAIALAVVAALALSLGAQFQKGAVNDHQKLKLSLSDGLNLKQLVQLLARPKWLSGLGFMVLGIIFQLAALTFAPLIVVQPIGAIALVFTAFINARVTKSKPNRATVVAIVFCVGGIGLFVTLASSVAREVQIDDQKLLQILIALGALLVAFGLLFFLLRKRHGALNYIVGAGVLYGFVATLAKVVIQRIEQQQFEWLTFCCLLALAAAVSLGSWFVQNAYSSGPPDLVIAGLTVLDPIVAVLIAVIILNEAHAASGLVEFGFVVSGLLAIVGVYLISRVHPEMIRNQLARLRNRLSK
jgi:drug/metabolite transporter (DMT)-like permease